MNAKHSLICHPIQKTSHQIQIQCEIEIREAMFLATFHLKGGVADLLIPDIQKSPNRKDDLWHSTCFEVFLLFANGKYLEFNLSSSLDWNLYCFNEYRKGQVLYEPEFIQNSREDGSGILKLTSEMAWKNFRQPLKYGLSAIIEDRKAEKSYWAIKHTDPVKPDFHDERNYILID